MKGALYSGISAKEQTASSDTQIVTFGESGPDIEKMSNENRWSLRFLAWLARMETENPEEHSTTVEPEFHKSQMGTEQVLYGHGLA